MASRVQSILQHLAQTPAEGLSPSLTSSEPKLETKDIYWGSGSRRADDTSIRPFKIDVPQNILDDLQVRLKNVRFPQPLPEDCPPWFFGFDTNYMRELVTHWRENYDWRKYEAKLNQFPHFKTEIDGIDLHFIHAKSSRSDAIPVLISHGWPGSVWEFETLIPLLTDPADGSQQAFDVIAPSIPGYGWSSPAKKVGYNAIQAAKTFSKLMKRLGYDKYIAQGGDWGSLITNTMPLVDPDGCQGIHLQMLIAVPGDQEGLSKEEKEKIEAVSFGFEETGYSHEQATKPQTLGFGLSDSPVGVAAWIVEKFHRWSDIRGGLENAYTKDELLTNVMIYWVTNTISSSVRLYKETNVWDTDRVNPEITGGLLSPIEVPMAHSYFPYELRYIPRKWAEAKFKNIVVWNEYDKGGHFAAREVPDIIAKDIRELVAKMGK